MARDSAGSDGKCGCSFSSATIFTDLRRRAFMNPFYHQDGSRDASDIFSGVPSGSHSQGQMNFQPGVNMDMLENLLMQDPSGASNQHQQHSQPSATPQALLEHQVKFTQLQQLQQLQQQLQQQIFQQQLDLLSGSSPLYSNVSSVIHRARDTPQFGLPTPVSSTELRAQQNTDFVSPMLLHSNGGTMGTMAQNPALLPNFMSQLPQHMLPSAPHSAPANIVFQSPGYALPSPGDLDLSELPPISSPMLDSYHNSGSSFSSGNSSQNTGRLRSGTIGSKRPNASSSGDESSVTSRPARKRPSPADRKTITASSSGKKTNRPTRSATSTPLFPATAPSSVRPSPVQRGMQGLDIPGDTPSPVDPPMPPPAHPPLDAPPSVISDPSTSSTPPPPATPVSPTGATQPSQIQPVTPAQMFKLGRLAVGNNLVSPPNTQEGTTVAKQKEGRPTTRSATGASKSKAADKTAGGQLISPALKPIRPAGNAVMTPSTASPSTPFMPPQIRKSSHKAAEQKRRDSLKTSFDDLRVLLPPIPLPSEEGYPDEPIPPGAMPPRGPPKGNSEGPNRGVSKLQLLRCGNEFIKVLKSRTDRRDEEITRLRQEVRRLRELVGEEAAVSPDGQGMIDLERDLDECETSGGMFGRAMAGIRASSIVEGDAEDDGDS
ncbi:hypothetical protein C8Q74DRAFT_1294199 [Fomes fomentarius]|nr:hypothetical protein C8Q74DRAFT_1294199 [Fomes fomentarius]